LDGPSCLERCLLILLLIQRTHLHAGKAFHPVVLAGGVGNPLDSFAAFLAFHCQRIYDVLDGMGQAGHLFKLFTLILYGLHRASFHAGGAVLRTGQVVDQGIALHLGGGNDPTPSKHATALGMIELSTAAEGI
jgi:hypothetical protein